ncbi:hypothetical protein M9Y10_004590 [Tritrichomonas musculus]|uniref:RING-type domain-containing protein n=1 Tax=Tritrichomonas musculus TaxID=1915356 RepID=A0ABR2JJ51_9EUKA
MTKVLIAEKASTNIPNIDIKSIESLKNKNSDEATYRFTEGIPSPIFVTPRLTNHKNSQIGFSIHSTTNLISKFERDAEPHVAEAFDSIIRRDNKLFNSLINSGLNLNHQIFDNETLLHCAIESHNVEAAKMLIDNGCSIDARTLNFQDSPINLAIQEEQEEIFQMLVSKGANIEIENFEGETPIFTAIRYGNVKFVEKLISLKANVNKVNKGGNTPLHIAMMLHQEEIGKILLKNGSDVKKGEGNSLRIAQQASQIDLASQVRDKNPELAKDPLPNYFIGSLMLKEPLPVPDSDILPLVTVKVKTNSINENEKNNPSQISSEEKTETLQTQEAKEEISPESQTKDNQKEQPANQKEETKTEAQIKQEKEVKIDKKQEKEAQEAKEEISPESQANDNQKEQPADQKEEAKTEAQIKQEKEVADDKKQEKEAQEAKEEISPESQAKDNQEEQPAKQGEEAKTEAQKKQEKEVKIDKKQDNDSQPKQGAVKEVEDDAKKKAETEPEKVSGEEMPQSSQQEDARKEQIREATQGTVKEKEEARQEKELNSEKETEGRAVQLEESKESPGGREKDDENSPDVGKEEAEQEIESESKEDSKPPETVEQEAEQEGEIKEQEGEIKEQEGEIKEQEGEIKEQEGEIKEQEGEIKEQEGEIKEQEGEIKEQEGEIKEQEGEIKEQEGEIKEQEGEIKEQEGEIKEQEGEIKEQEGEIKEQEGEIKEQEGEIKEQEGEIKEQEGEIKESERASGESKKEAENESGSRGVAEGQDDAELQEAAENKNCEEDPQGSRDNGRDGVEGAAEQNERCQPQPAKEEAAHQGAPERAGAAPSPLEAQKDDESKAQDSAAQKRHRHRRHRQQGAKEAEPIAPDGQREAAQPKGPAGEDDASQPAQAGGGLEGKRERDEKSQEARRQDEEGTKMDEARNPARNEEASAQQEGEPRDAQGGAERERRHRHHRRHRRRQDDGGAIVSQAPQSLESLENSQASPPYFPPPAAGGPPLPGAKAAVPRWRLPRAEPSEEMRSLYAAIKARSLAQVRALLEKRLNLDALDEAAMTTPLIYAVDYGNLEIVKLLTAAGASIDFGAKLSPIHLAIRQKKNDIVNFFLQNGCDVNTVTSENESPIYDAIRAADLKLVQLLVSKGANVNVLNSNNMSPLYVAVGRRNLPIVKYLLSENADPNGNGLPCLKLAQTSKDTQMINILTDSGAKQLARKQHKSRLQMVALSRAGPRPRAASRAENGSCMICNGTSNLLKLIPCGHVVVCKKCIDVFVDKYSSCPICSMGFYATALDKKNKE